MRFTVVMAGDGNSLLPTASLYAEGMWILPLRGASEYKEGSQTCPLGSLQYCQGTCNFELWIAPLPGLVFPASDSVFSIWCC